jgi:twinkle protein
MLPPKGMWGFFGWHLVKPTDTSVIVTEGEYDAMAVAQGLAALPLDDPLRAVPVISLPNGCNSLPTDLIPLLEPFKKVYLWMDNDKSGIDAAEKFARKLGITRCMVVKPLKANSKVSLLHNK